ncbi:MAG: radical SAM protein [Gemmatimonadaceae bacterium]|nr:radical SAM protein [Gemmatimonadaceae bacterium]
MLSYEEIVAVVAELAPLGLRRIRLTGGEPTIRPELDSLVRQLRAVPLVEDMATLLTETGCGFLASFAHPLREAGLDLRINMSADSLRAERIVAIARRNMAFDPVASLRVAQAAGLSPIKVNVVVMRGINDDEVLQFARLTQDHPWHVRFIELMPVGEMQALTWDHVVPAAEILERLAAIDTLASDAGPARGNGPAAYYRFPGAPGTVGVITPMTHTYCGTCNRVRLTADGRLRTCLFGDHEVNLRDALRAGQPLAPLFREALAGKPKEHALLQMQVGGLRALSQVGG